MHVYDKSYHTHIPEATGQSPILTMASVIASTKKFSQEKAAETTKQNEEKREKLKPEEQEGMPQHQHCPPAKRRGDRNP
jgi:hypothetical protein